jgi:two-component system, chemotaxis family, chemotaxis protein CheY
MSPHCKASVLVVDDNEAAREIVGVLLEFLGFEDIQMADSGQMAMEKLHSGKITLVICDWNMQPMNGLELLRRVRAEYRFREMRFIFISGEASAEHVIAARESGANSFILKPFNSDGLKAKIADAFRNAGPTGRPVPHTQPASPDWALSTCDTERDRFSFARAR